jgi:hypothetical protein
MHLKVLENKNKTNPKSVPKIMAEINEIETKLEEQYKGSVKKTFL